MTTVSHLATEAVRSGSRSTLVAAFVLAGRQCAEEEARGDVRDGLIDMPLPFRAAEKLGYDPDEIVAEALASLDGRAAELLRSYAGRPDRTNIGVMGWDERLVDGRFAFGMGDP